MNRNPLLTSFSTVLDSILKNVFRRRRSELHLMKRTLSFRISNDFKCSICVPLALTSFFCNSIHHRSIGPNLMNISRKIKQKYKHSFSVWVTLLKKWQDFAKAHHWNLVAIVLEHFFVNVHIFANRDDKRPAI